MIDPSRLHDDRSLFLSINEWARDTPWLHGFLTDYANYGVALFALLLLAGYVIARRRRSARDIAAAIWAGGATLIAVGLNQPIASGVDEPRPFTVYHHILVLVHHSADPSFASDHATMAGAVVVGTFLVSRRLGVVATVAGLLMAFARVYVGAHFPVDVVAGLLLGGLVAGLGWLLLHRPLQWLVEQAGRTPLRVVLPAE
ncbi:MAG TPA: phosphatase PAP2 family protein [Mycobacteriales bacterium]|nr:phosphatase PAP2 family protein [Mycobacteriales bacterium]